MFESELVHGSPARTGADRGLAGGLQHSAAAQLLGVPDARRICGGQWLWKRRWLRHLGKRYAFPTFPQPRRRRPYFDPCNGTKNPGSFVMTGPKTGGRSNPTNHLSNNISCALFMFTKFTPNPIEGSGRTTTALALRIVLLCFNWSCTSVPRGSECVVCMKQPTRLTSDVRPFRHKLDSGSTISASAMS